MGIAERCSGHPGSEASGSRWHVGASVGSFRTVLVFDDARLNSEQLAVSVALEFRVSRRWSLQAAVGSILLGQLGVAKASPGVVGSLAGSWLALEQGRLWPFVQLSGSVSASSLRFGGVPFTAFDARLGVLAGYTVGQRITPYLVGRVFGGPVLFRGSTGTDAYHVQLGVGAVLGLTNGLDVAAEVVPFGEQRVSLSVGYRL